MDPDFLKCRICENYLKAPIRRCGTHSTHNFCAKCINQKNNICTICQSPVPSTNDVAMEALLKIQKHKCKNENCKVEVTLAEKLDHERNCKFNRRVKCEYNEFCKPRVPCVWNGTPTQIEQHFRSHKPRFGQNPIQVDIRFNRNYKFLQLLNEHNELFWYKHFVNIQTQKVYFLIQAINSELAHKFEFKIQFISIVDSNKYWTMKGDIGDANEDADAYFMSENCKQSGFQQLKPFIHNENLYMNLEIYPKGNREQFNKNANNKAGNRPNRNNQGRGRNRSQGRNRDQSHNSNKEQETNKNQGNAKQTENRAFVKGQNDFMFVNNVPGPSCPADNSKPNYPPSYQEATTTQQNYPKKVNKPEEFQPSSNFAAPRQDNHNTARTPHYCSGTHPHSNNYAASRQNNKQKSNKSKDNDCCIS